MYFGYITKAENPAVGFRFRSLSSIGLAGSGE